jgi:hypothetical protein
MGKDVLFNRKQNKTLVVKLISDKIYYKSKTVAKDKKKSLNNDKEVNS